MNLKTFLARLAKESPASVDLLTVTGADPEEDILALRCGDHTRESLLAFCLDGAEESDHDAWRAYVSAACIEAWVSQ